MNEVQAARKGIYLALTEAAGVTALVGSRVYRSRPPQARSTSDTVFPCIVFSFQAGSNVHASGADRRVVTRPLFLVKAVVRGEDEAPADAIANALDAALTGLSRIIAVGAQSYQVQACFQESPVDYVERTQGVEYMHVGGLYRLFVHALP